LSAERGIGQGTVKGENGNLELPESRCSFVSQGVVGEMLRRPECPEIPGRAKANGGRKQSDQDQEHDQDLDQEKEGGDISLDAAGRQI
jgi:hypothetical protein